MKYYLIDCIYENGGIYVWKKISFRRENKIKFHKMWLVCIHFIDLFLIPDIVIEFSHLNESRADYYAFYLLCKTKKLNFKIATLAAMKIFCLIQTWTAL